MPDFPPEILVTDIRGILADISSILKQETTFTIVQNEENLKQVILLFAREGLSCNLSQPSLGPGSGVRLLVVPTSGSYWELLWLICQ